MSVKVLTIEMSGNSEIMKVGAKPGAELRPRCSCFNFRSG